jgi:hypothetical protein
MRSSTVVVGLLLASAVSCRRPRPAEVPLPTTPEAALQALGRAAQEGDAARLWVLLDQTSRWSLMSVQRDLREICNLVRGSYPREQQARELQRCRQAAEAKTAEELFVAYAKAQRLLQPLARIGAPGPRRGAGDSLEIESGGTRVALCREQRREAREERAGWAYCGLRAHLDAMKLKAARDLVTVQENVESYKGR